MAGVRAYAAEVAGKEPQFIRHAAKFLNSASWENAVEASGPAAIVVDEAQWAKRLAFARREHAWDSGKWGPAPNAPGCIVPANLIETTDGAGWREWEKAA